jgi:hypothetical protein
MGQRNPIGVTRGFNERGAGTLATVPPYTLVAYRSPDTAELSERRVGSILTLAIGARGW